MLSIEQVQFNQLQVNLYSYPHQIKQQSQYPDQHSIKKEIPNFKNHKFKKYLKKNIGKTINLKHGNEQEENCIHGKGERKNI